MRLQRSSHFHLAPDTVPGTISSCHCLRAERCDFDSQPRKETRYAEMGWPTSSLIATMHLRWALANPRCKVTVQQNR